MVFLLIHLLASCLADRQEYEGNQEELKRAISHAQEHIRRMLTCQVFIPRREVKMDYIVAKLT